jgi:hypothetical protein
VAFHSLLERGFMHMEWIFYTVGVVFSLLGLGCVLLVALGLPGIWIMLGLSFVLEFADQLYLPAGQTQTFSWKVLIACVVLALLGEVLEFFAGALGAKKAGSSKRGMIGAVIGGLVGAVLGTGIPIPVFGTLVGAVLGTFGGALLGEMTRPDIKTAQQSLKPALGATIGRLLGTLIKIPVALTIWITLCVAVFWK